MSLKSHGLNKKDLSFTVLLFAAFSALFSLFPYTGDDWAWGSQIGLDRLASWFENYNGRYFGNLLVMVLTRSKPVNVLLTAASMVAFCLLPKLFVKSEKFLPYALGTLFFFLIPQNMRVQVVVWTAGFSNYVPPIVLIFLYLILVRNVFDDEEPKYGKMAVVVSPIIGFTAALFMENVTLYNLVAAAAIMAIVYFRFRKVYAVHIAYLAGSIAGAAMMFANSAYGTIAQGGDEYRSSVLDQGLIGTIANNMNVIVRSLFLDNLAAWGILTLLCLICYGLYLRSGERKKICHLAVGIHLLCGGMLVAKGCNPDWLFFVNTGAAITLTILLFAAMAVGYCLSALILIFFCVEERKTKLQVLFLLLSIPVLAAPLLVVNPVGERCLFASYMMQAAASVALLMYVMERVRISAAAQKALVAVILAVCVVLMGSLVNVYRTVHQYDVLRNEYVRKQVDAGYKTVMMSRLPHEDKVWCSVPENLWAERYKLFHGIDPDVEFELLEPAQFDEWMAAFDAAQK